jgi:hypothetical protein
LKVNAENRKRITGFGETSLKRAPWGIADVGMEFKPVAEFKAFSQYT